MKTTLLLFAMACCLGGFAQVKMPAPSTTQTLSQAFGLGNIQITYARPNIKGRTLFKENSELAPLGKMWRTGANAATKIKFTDKVMIGGTLIDTGSYALYTQPGKEYWEVIINKGIGNWGAMGYKESENIVSTKIKTEKVGSSVETFTIQFANVQPESCDLQLVWGNVQVSIPISTNVKERVLAQIEKALTAEKIEGNTYFAAANYYFEWEKDYAKALTYITKATEANAKAYWILLQQARIQKALGDKVAAKASAEKVVVLATEGTNDDYVRAANELLRKL